MKTKKESLVNRLIIIRKSNKMISSIVLATKKENCIEKKKKLKNRFLDLVVWRNGYRKGTITFGAMEEFKAYLGLKSTEGENIDNDFLKEYR